MPYDWISTLPDVELDELIEGLQGSEGMVTAHHVYRALDDELWKRHSVAITEWPVILWGGDAKDLKVYSHCEKTRSKDDPKHRPSRLLSRRLTASDRINSPSGFHGFVLCELGERIECTCGHRGTGLHKERTPDSPLGWPVEVDGKLYTCPNLKKYPNPLEHAMTGRHEWCGLEFGCLCSGFHFRVDQLKLVKQPFQSALPKKRTTKSCKKTR
jgi:hypothetical protein